MNALLSQLPESLLNSLTGAGVLGIVVAVLFYRDFKRDERDFKREESRNIREAKRDDQMERLTGALHNLIRISSIEVLTRPSVQERTQEEAREIHRDATKREA